MLPDWEGYAVPTPESSNIHENLLEWNRHKQNNIIFEQESKGIRSHKLDSQDDKFLYEFEKQNTNRSKDYEMMKDKNQYNKYEQDNFQNENFVEEKSYSRSPQYVQLEENYEKENVNHNINNSMIGKIIQKDKVLQYAPANNNYKTVHSINYKGYKYL